MKNVLVLIHDDAGQEARLQAALDLTRALGGHLRCVDVNPITTLADDMTFMGAAAVLAEVRADERANSERVQERVRREDVPFDWMDVATSLDSALRDAAFMADVVVLNRSLDDVFDPGMRHLIRDLIVQSGKPVFAVPQDCRGVDLTGHAIVAWDGSAEAEAALRNAVPLLVGAGQVTLLEIRDRAEGDSATEAATYLSRHGIHASVRSIDSRGAPAADVLLAETRTLGASYMAMGGFGRGRLLEELFGGVTRSMLERSAVPLFLVH